MSFTGGGSDMPDFYREHGGAVLSTSIDRFVYVTVSRKFDDGIRVAYSKTEEVSTVDEIEHRLVKSVLRHLEIAGGVEITTVADIPSRGTGLGSSSSFTVALLQALYAFRGQHASRDRLAEESCHLEINVCNEPIGKQDQYAAAYGGLNLIEFHPDHTVVVSPVICHQSTVHRLQNNLLLLYTGMTRSASDVLHQQREAVRTQPGKRDVVKRMVQLSYQLYDELQRNNLDAFGEILHENWILKKSLVSNISTNAIDDWYSIAQRNGAKGGKLLGAGAGGFLLLYAEADKHDQICQALPLLRPTPVSFDRQGSQIIFYNPLEKTTVPAAPVPLQARAAQCE
jgi:D-glycero-alpha-D-manno-heptose-7-phosphate kinase